MATKKKITVQSADADIVEATPVEKGKKDSTAKAKPAARTRKKVVEEVIEAVPVEPTKRKIPKVKAEKTVKTNDETKTAEEKPVNPFAKYDEIISEDEKKSSNKPRKAVRVKVAEAEPISLQTDDDDDTPEADSERPKSGKRKPKGPVFEEFLIDDASASIASLTKGNVWGTDIDEIYSMLVEGRRTEHWAENEVHYMNIIRPVFDIRYFNYAESRKEDDKEKDKVKDPEKARIEEEKARLEEEKANAVIAQLETEGFKTYPYPTPTNANGGIALRKHKINKITDLTMENILHLEAYEVLKLIKENMGTGWKGLPLSIQDIIETAFYVDQSSLPEAIMHRVGGIIDRRKDDGYEVLEIQRGNWIEAVFLKYKPRMEKIHFESTTTRFGKSEDEELDNDEDIDDEEEDDIDEGLDLNDEEDDEEIEEEPTQLEDFDDIPEEDEDE